jgi:signal transduction histidine kinase/ActR/RegA family two-component response regulator
VVTLVLEGREHILRSVSGSCGDTCPNLSSLIGHTHAELAPELHRELGPMLDEVYTSGRPRVILDLEVRDRVNETRHSRISLIPLPGDRGHARGVVLMSLDVTESVRVEKDRAELLAREREARERAEHADRMKDEFLARVSHELATPLAAMRMWIHLLRKRSHDEHGHELDSIERCADAQSRLVTDLLDVSRAIRGKLSLDLKTFDLAQVMTPVIDGLRGDADSKQVSLAARLDPECIVRGDVKRLGQVATNLITNALKFTREGGKVTVTVAHRGAGVMLTVDDDGVGIEPRQLAKIFEPFWQADGSATRSQGGLGLGLAIVRQIVELHGGSVRALSEGRDRGARLEVSLPAAEASGEDEERGAHASSLDGTDILLVEDDAETRASVTMVLKSFGANVRVASSAELGARELAEKVPDVLLCDVAMPGEDGYSLMRRVRKADGPEAQVLAIAFTAHARDEDRARAREAGFNDHLAKPIAPLELASALAKITQQKRVSD